MASWGVPDDARPPRRTGSSPTILAQRAPVAPRAPRAETWRATTRLARTRTEGRLHAGLVAGMGDDWDRGGRAPAWLVDATETADFEPDAVTVLVATLRTCHAQGLRRVVLVAPADIVRMAARAVAASVAFAGLEARVVETLAEGEALVRDASG